MVRMAAIQVTTLAGLVSVRVAIVTSRLYSLEFAGSLDLPNVAEFSPGLEGVVAAETAVSEVDGANGRLIYRGGYLIEDLVPVTSYEEVAYLLWHGDLPNHAELEALRKQMARGRKLNEAARGALMAMDPATDPMDVLRTV